jgi:hypothetical protein
MSPRARSRISRTSSLHEQNFTRFIGGERRSTVSHLHQETVLMLPNHWLRRALGADLNLSYLEIYSAHVSEPTFKRDDPP